MSPRSRFPIIMVWTIAAAIVLTGNAIAYIGPGSGMEFFTYAMGLVAMVGVAILSILMWPFYTFMRWLRGPKTPPTTEQQPVAAEPSDGAALQATGESPPAEAAPAATSSPPVP